MQDGIKMQDEPIIHVKNVSKTFRWQKKYKGISGPFRNLFRPRYESVEAVKSLTMEIQRGETVAFLGPNGAGKSTTIKMICGILKPTDGSINLMGKDSWKNRPKLVRDIGVCFGNKSQLWWNLPVYRTYELLKTMYEIPDDRYKKNLDLFSEILGIHEYLDKPVRQLSFGQKMKAEFAACMLHDPQIVLLDEPTVGLDIVARQEFAEFIRKIARERNATVMLCTHDLNDVESICSRVVVINHGMIVKDSTMENIRVELSRDYRMNVEYADPVEIPDENPTIGVEPNTDSMRHYSFSVDLTKTTIDDVMQYVRKFGSINFMELKKKDIAEIIEIYYR